VERRLGLDSACRSRQACGSERRARSKRSGRRAGTGWNTADNANIAPTDAHLDCNAYATWTATPENQERLPINCVSWYEASAFCIWDTAFLPSEAEWEYAAVGGDEERQYPWGNAAPGADNQRQIYACDYPDGSGHCTDVTNLAPVGTAVQGADRWGQLDLTGNVEEWVLDYYVVPFPDGACADCAALTPTSKRSIRGGNYSENASNVLPTWRDANLPTARDSYSGIRCARSGL
jgi:sulfatase modifying factor 1